MNLAVFFQHLGGVHANPLPPGVTLREAGSKTLLGPKETKGKIVLQAAANAGPIDAVPICVMGHVSINFVVKTSYAGHPLWWASRSDSTRRNVNDCGMAARAACSTKPPSRASQAASALPRRSRRCRHSSGATNPNGTTNSGIRRPGQR